MALHTSRDLFLSVQWKRYPSVKEALAEINPRNFEIQYGRVLRHDRDECEILTLDGLHQTFKLASAHEWRWLDGCLKHPTARESAPPVWEVWDVGDWIVTVSERSQDRLKLPTAVRVGILAPNSVLGSRVESSELLERARQWSHFLQKIRDFFFQRNFLETTTPTLAVSPGTEPFLSPLKVPIEFSGQALDRYLITSPEFHLKKVLASGAPRIFEIAKCFRNQEGGEHHRIEFHMLEWYRAMSDLDEIAGDVEDLISTLRPGTKMRRVSVAELFQKHTGFVLTPQTNLDDVRHLARALEIRFVSQSENADDFGDLFHRIWLEKIEPELAREKDPVLVHGYPPSMAALARIRADGFADRFEVFWCGLELCNAFHELTDPQENRKRFESDNSEKKKRGYSPVPIDEELMRALQTGMPPSGGIALGLERLFMAVHGVKDIGRVAPFSSIV